jgi:hypothetical protein
MQYTLKILVCVQFTQKGNACKRLNADSVLRIARDIESSLNNQLILVTRLKTGLKYKENKAFGNGCVL